MGIVYFFQIIQIEQAHRQGQVSLAERGHGGLKPPPVQQARQGIPVGLILQDALPPAEGRNVHQPLDPPVQVEQRVALAQKVVGLQRQRQFLHLVAAGNGGQDGDLPEGRLLPQGLQHRGGAVSRKGHAQDHGGNAALTEGAEAAESAYRVS